MSKQEAISLIVGAVFNIAIIILQALRLTDAATALEQIAPEVNIIVIAVLSFFSIRRYVRGAIDKAARSVK